jgi:hypothetical protein
MSKLNARVLEHWLFSSVIQGHLQRKRIPFDICGISASGDESMKAYEGSTARTVPPTQCKSPPRDGEVIVSVVKGRRRPVQISIDPKFLVPWKPMGSGDVVVTDRDVPWFGIEGTIVRKENESCLVRITPVDETREESFEANQLAILEPLRT